MTINKAQQVFPRTEYLRRLAAVKSEMARREIDALVVSFDRNMNYLTGYTARSGYIPQGLVVSSQEEEPTIILRKMDAPAAHHQTFLARDRVIGYPESLIGNPEKDGYDAVIDFVQDLGAVDRSIGLEFGNLPTPTLDKFRLRLPQAKIVDFTSVITWIRMIKSDLEIALMREAAAITDAGIRRASEVIRSGVREADAAAEIVATLARGANGKAGTSLASFWMNSSPRAGTSHLTWSDDLFRDDSQVNLEIAGVRYTYTAPVSRTFSIGRPSDRLRRVHEAQIDGLEAALDTIRAGRTCSDVAQAAHRALAKHSVQKESRYGYPVGIDWTEQTASLMEGDMTVLKPNMTFHVHLGNWIDEDFGVMVSQCIRVTETGVEVLTKAPLKLIELPSAA